MTFEIRTLADGELIAEPGFYNISLDRHHAQPCNGPSVTSGILRKMGIGAVRQMTNNPRKVTMLEGHGIRVAERVPLITPRNRHNSGYLDVKAQKSGHLL